MRLSCRGGCRLVPHRPVVSRLNLHFQIRFHRMCNRPGRSIGGSAACVVLTDNRSLRSRLVRAVPCVGLTEHRSLRSRLHPRHRLRPPAVHPFMLRRVLRPSLLRRALLRRERRPSSSPVVVLWGKAHIAHGWGKRYQSICITPFTGGFHPHTPGEMCAGRVLHCCYPPCNIHTTRLCSRPGEGERSALH